MADNTITLADPADGRFQDWFELYNPGTNVVDLGGYYLTDTLTNLFQFRIPSAGRYLVPPRGFLLVWADNEPSQNTTTDPNLHVNFKLNKAGEAIGLFAADGTAIDAITFGPQESDVSQGRYPDGAPSIFRMPNATPRLPNMLPNTAPELSVISNVSMTLGQRLAFTVIARDTDQPPQALSFSLGAGAPPGATIDRATGFFTWTPETAPAIASVTVTATDNGLPPLSTSQTFFVVVFPPPHLESIALTNGQFALDWQSGLDLTYQLEYADDLQVGTWTSLGSPLTGTGGTLELTNNLPVSPRRFYRLRLLPP
jgi:hypothetical protein